MFTAEFTSHAPARDKHAVRDALHKLKERYREPHRFYHNLAHIENGLKLHRTLCPDRPLTPLEFFAWAYHDSVYDTKQSNNEQQSADVFLRDAPTLGFSMDECDRVTRLILATDPSAPQSLSVINDIDLTGLGAEPAVYDLNTANIRKEYYWVEPQVWRKGRSGVLIQIMKRPQLYITEPYISTFTDQAIANMSRELTSLL